MPYAELSLPFPLAIEYARECLVLSTLEERIKFTGIRPDIGCEVLQAINERRSLNKIEPQDQNTRLQVQHFLQTLKSEALLHDRSVLFYRGAELSVLLKRYFEQWNQILFSAPLWTSLAAGAAAAEILNGWLIETYHFIKGANARLSYAAAHANDERVRAIFTRHYLEEYDHYKFFAESLRRRGFDPEQVDAVGPLPSTVAVQNMARRAARADCLAYAACSGLLESTGSDAMRAREFYNSLATHYDSAGTGFVVPMLEHVALDERYGHGSVMADVLEPIPVILAERADKIIESVSLFQETLALWFGDIARFYSGPSGTMLDQSRSYQSNPQV